MQRLSMFTNCLYNLYVRLLLYGKINRGRCTVYRMNETLIAKGIGGNLHDGICNCITWR